MSTSQKKYWLLKAEPDSRIVKGKDVKFSVDDFERVKTSPWEGVRNYEARNLMKEMKVGDKALFYHSNCKMPGIAALAQVAKEAYPDYTAWDPAHPYYDPKSDSDDPKWFMVDLSFVSRAQNFVSLALLRKIADSPPAEIPEELSYLGDAGIKAIKSMDLVTRGRLSVQRVREDAWDAIVMLAEKGGWEDVDLKPAKKGRKSSTKNTGETSSPPKSRGKVSKKRASSSEQEDLEGLTEEETSSPVKPIKSKRKREEIGDLRRSTRTKNR